MTKALTLLSSAVRDYREKTNKQKVLGSVARRVSELAEPRYDS